MVERGEAEISHIALLAPKLTEANADILLPGIKNRSTREVQALLSRVTMDSRSRL